METADIGHALEHLPGIRVTAVQGGVRVHVPAIDDTVRIDAAAVRRCRGIRAPNGDPAVEFVLGDEHGVWPLILTPDDVVFQPVATGAVLDSSIQYRITDAPDLVAYSEMERAAEQAALECERPGSIELFGVGASLVLVRCYVVAATLIGLRPVRSVAWWRRGWEALAGDLPFPPFRPDPVWDELVANAARIAVTASASGTSGDADEVDGVGIADFRRLEPALTAVGLDDEFVSTWRTWMPVTPARFVATLLHRLDAARADVALYPGGGGSVDVVLREGGATALLQFSWSDRAELHVDEVRIDDPLAHTGLFQRMMFNTERLAVLLGFSKLTLLATGIGSVAFATVGYPRDPELFRALRHGR